MRNHVNPQITETSELIFTKRDLRKERGFRLLLRTLKKATDALWEYWADGKLFTGIFLRSWMRRRNFERKEIFWECQKILLFTLFFWGEARCVIRTYNILLGVYPVLWYAIILCNRWIFHPKNRKLPRSRRAFFRPVGNSSCPGLGFKSPILFI